MATEDDPVLNKPGTSLTIDKKPKNKGKNKLVCYPFLEGKCKYGEKCYKSHDTTILKIINKKSSKPIEKNQNSDSKESSGGGGNNKSTFVAASLPMQDFHQ